MVHGTVKGLLGLVSTLVLIVLVAAAALAYRLSQGPLSLDFMTPAVENALARLAGGQSVELDQTTLEWDTEHRSLAIHLHNVRSLGADNRVLASVPDATVSFSGPALVTGQLAVRGIRLIRPHLHLLRTAQGGFALGLGDAVDADAAAAIDSAIGATLTQPEGKTAQQIIAPAAAPTLDRVEIAGGALDFDEPAASIHWHAPQIDLLAVRSESGVSITLRGPIQTEASAQGGPGTISANAYYRSDTAAVSGTLHWTGLRPASFAPLTSGLKPLERFQLATGGTADFNYVPTSGLTRLTLDVSGGAGTIDAAPWAGMLHVTALEIRGTLSDGLDALVLDGLSIDLGGPKIEAKGQAKGLTATPHLDVAVRADNVPLALVPTLWPVGLAPNPREWVTANLSGGAIRHAEMKLVAKVPIGGTGDADIESLSGNMQGDGIAVHYLGSLPSVRNAAGSATFDKDSMTITVKGGSAAGITVKGGTIVFTGFSAVEQAVQFNLDFEAAVPDVIKLIDAKPLGFASSLGFDPAHARGNAAISLDMHLPLAKTVRLSQAKLKVHAKTQGLGVPKVALGLDLTDGALDLDIDPHGMDVAGSAKLGAIPIDLQWRENFVPAAFVSRYQVKALLDQAARDAVGLDDPAFQAPVLVGTVPVEATATMLRGGRGDVTLKADFTPVAMRLPGLNWSKPAGKPGTAEAQLRLNAGGVAAVPHFAVTAAGGLELRGDVAFDTGTRPRRISLTTAKWGRTDIKGTVLFKPDGSLGVDISGAAFDASELVNGGAGPHSVEEQQALAVSAKLARVWLSDDGSIRNVAAILARGPRHWRFVRIDGALDKGQPLHVDVKPSDDKHRSLKIGCNDAGGILAAFGLTKNIRGGALTVDGVYDDADPKETLTGTLKISNYRLVNAPLMARVLTAVSLTGTGALLAGDGIQFDKAEAPFTVVDGLVTFKDAHTAGTELGLTANGQLDLDHDALALQGTIVPAYAINSLVGKIPLIGDILTGEKNSGLIAFTYSVNGPSSNPSISVNPLSALAPGILRRLFNVFDNGSGTKVQRPDTSKSGASSSPAPSSPSDPPPTAGDR